MAKTVGMVSLGCSKNRVDSEQILGMLKENGFEITNDEAQAEVIIVNTCGFINPAKEESIGAILEMAQHKKNGSCRLLVQHSCRLRAASTTTGTGATQHSRQPLCRGHGCGCGGAYSGSTAGAVAGAKCLLQLLRARR